MQHTHTIQQLKILEQNYQPSPTAAARISSKTLLAFIGAFAVGKTTLISEIARLDARFSEVISFTTRPSRGPDDVYRFIDHTAENLAHIAKKAEEKRLINLAVHPTTGYIYGTEPSDYRTEFCMLATIAHNFETSTRHLPFKTAVPVTIVVQPDAWVKRIRERTESHAEYTARMAEARQSLQWSLAQKQMYFIDNTSEDIATVARQFTADAQQDFAASSKNARHIAEEMLRFIAPQLS